MGRDVPHAVDPDRDAAVSMVAATLEQVPPGLVKVTTPLHWGHRRAAVEESFDFTDRGEAHSVQRGLPGRFNQWCRPCGGEGLPRDRVVRRLAYEPLGWRPTSRTRAPAASG